ncbi:MAG TPA: helix-turn-helix transcriptional regulator [Treponemataceae bacterium]|jgi:transcriptional regulator with XRE-family HTH domain|nr:helix-turn-helix transcriptional regulator [Treponemataceae bacterium]HPM11198.1 helix-turn-helix transcriptional regulator [Paludibacter sp.]
MSSFKERVKSELSYKGWILKELAAQTGISKRTLDSYLDSREVMPSADQAVKIAKALQVTVEYLVTGKDSHKEAPMSPDARKLMELFSILDERDKQTVLNLVESLSDRYANGGETEKSSFPAG